MKIKEEKALELRKYCHFYKPILNKIPKNWNKNDVFELPVKFKTGNYYVYTGRWLFSGWVKIKNLKNITPRFTPFKNFKKYLEAKLKR